MLEELVDHRSGLLGISGVGSDMRRLREAASSNADARLAIQMFCYSVRKQVAAMIATLDGVDLVVFTGGIGENDEEARAAICGGLSWIGVSLDEARNRSANNPINDPASRCSVRVLASEEDEQIAAIPGHCSHRVFPDSRRQRLLKLSANPPRPRQEQHCNPKWSLSRLFSKSGWLLGKCVIHSSVPESHAPSYPGNVGNDLHIGR
jgi:Acetokinase family